jgi:hypothetical protein
MQNGPANVRCEDSDLYSRAPPFAKKGERRQKRSVHRSSAPLSKADSTPHKYPKDGTKEGTQANPMLKLIISEHGR